MTKFCFKAVVLSIAVSAMLVVEADTAFAQGTRKLAVLPFRVYEIDSTSTMTLLSLLRRELEKEGVYSVIDESLTPQTPCQDVACAADVGVPINADRVVFGSFSKLGSKILWTYTLVDVKGKSKVFTGDVTRWKVEEFAEAIPLIARSIGAGMAEPEPTASGKVIPPASSSYRHRDTMIIGIGFGQLYPTHGYIVRSGSYPDYLPDTVRREFVFDARVSLQRPKHTLDLLVGIRHGLLVNLGASYVPFNTSIAPYIGGGIGYHLVLDEDVLENDDPDYFISGFQAMIKGGVWVLNTSTIRAFVNVDYMYTFNSRDDQAVTLTIGVASVTDAFGF